ncbi:MAG: YwqG family protein [Phycisphaerae bacterium]|nr:YwqG family protein [Phycisphaerae bacterium]
MKSYFLEYCRLVFKKIKLYLWFRSKGLPQASVLKNSSLFKVNPRMGDPEKFRQQMLQFIKPTRELVLQDGTGEALPTTKIAGEPWWPEGVERPKCKDGHLMHFIAQILLSDVPLPDMPKDALLSFHYCEECAECGNMPWGYADDRRDGYDLRIFYDINQKRSDNLGMVVNSHMNSYNISLRDVEEVPNHEDDANIQFSDLPDDYPQGKDDFDENVYPGLKHVHKSKVGGWPSWVQYPEWPTNEKGDKQSFLGQFDWWTFDGYPWCAGGYAYLFLSKDESAKLKAELLIQTT